MNTILYPAEVFKDLVNAKDQQITLVVPRNMEFITSFKRKLSLYKTRNQFRYRTRVTPDMRLAFDIKNSQADEDAAILSISLVQTGAVTL